MLELAPTGGSHGERSRRKNDAFDAPAARLGKDVADSIGPAEVAARLTVSASQVYGS